MTNARTPSTYRVIQLGAPREPDGFQTNEMVTDFDSLVTHHPRANQYAQMVDGRIIDGELGRLHAIFGGEIEEIEMARPGRSQGLGPDQVLLKKDFILEDPDHPAGSASARAVDVPSPVAGYIGRVNERQGLVDVYDRQGGDVIARIRHMHPIAVSEGQTVAYGESLGTQGRQQTGAVHVHMEVDTRYYQAYENYIGDLVSGRLPVQSEHRENVNPRPIVEDGKVRLGEFDARVLDLQRTLDIEGYRAQGGGTLPQDGVYRASMQGAVLDFQRAHGVPQTGDIDLQTSRFAPREGGLAPPPFDPALRGRESLPLDVHPPGPRAPGHPSHPDHRPALPESLPPPVNGRRTGAGGTGSEDLDRLYDALLSGDERAISTACEDIRASLITQDMHARNQSTWRTQSMEHEAALEQGASARTL